MLGRHRGWHNGRVVAQLPTNEISKACMAFAFSGKTGGRREMQPTILV